MNRPVGGAFRVARHLTSLGMLGVEGKGRTITGIPFVNLFTCPMKSRAKDNYHYNAREGVVNILWRTEASHLDQDYIYMKAVDFAPMLAAWVEHERAERKKKS